MTWRGEEWTEAGDATLRRLWVEERSSSGVIADMMGRSRSAIMGRVRRLGLLRTASETKAPRSRKPRSERKSPLQRSKLDKPKSDAVQPRWVRPKKPARLAVLPAVEADNGPPKPATPPIGIMALASQSCRWPVDGGTEPGGLYCGSVRHPKHRSYCAYHRWLEVSPAARRRLAP